MPENIPCCQVFKSTDRMWTCLPWDFIATLGIYLLVTADKMISRAIINIDWAMGKHFLGAPKLNFALHPNKKLIA